MKFLLLIALFIISMVSAEPMPYKPRVLNEKEDMDKATKNLSSALSGFGSILGKTMKAQDEVNKNNGMFIAALITAIICCCCTACFTCLYCQTKTLLQSGQQIGKALQM